jgi:Cu/Ag efflux protein CusF
MRSPRAPLLLVVASLCLAGCAAYRQKPLAGNHPANPDAAVAPEPPRSRTLAYSPSDVPSARPIPSVAAPHQGHGSPPADGRRSETVVGEGEIVATVPNASQVVVEHGEIEGFMEAMTMGYRVDPPSLLAKVKPGDKVRFTIDVERRAIVELEKLP